MGVAESGLSLCIQGFCSSQRESTDIVNQCFERHRSLERFHQTLKTMLRTYCMTQKSDWDEGILLLLFAAREFNQGFLGFSPFELVLGHLQQGPLKLFKESWLDQMNDSQSVITHISDVCERLKVANELAKRI